MMRENEAVHTSRYLLGFRSSSPYSILFIWCSSGVHLDCASGVHPEVEEFHHPVL
ncbi:hypothetical protein HanXRQr2_Chr07g0316081 [Helianthus annuus]|uniref:Uncharacterized protein n=1 Tax=Helianthus annuus TaxID=4232 RepID=A0A9K3IQ08_HELAN|nr:hypothetical protein HanXRQr2_Chr07g0316081 [Helianthus annuus]